MKLYGFLVVLLLAGPAWSDIDHACFRRADPRDPGTVHLFIKNPADKPKVSVDRVYLNGMEMGHMPNDGAVWWQAVPPVCQPGEIMDVMVKLRRPTNKLIRIKAALDDGQTVETVLEPEPPDLKLTSISYDGDMTAVYLYLQNTGKEPVTLEKIFRNAEDITEECFIPERILPAGSKTLVVYAPMVGFLPGAYQVLKVTTDKNQAAEATSRVYSYFPIAGFGSDTRTWLDFDDDYFEMRTINKKNAARPAFKCGHVFDDPACRDGTRVKPVGTSAGEVIKRAKDFYENDPVHPTLIYSCEYQKPESYFMYGETTDIMAVAPYEMIYYRNPPEKDAYYTKLAKLACEPRPLWTMPEAFTSKGTRFPTPEEERIIVYSEIGEGSKGIWYFQCDPETGYPADPALEAEIGRINKELQLLKNYLVIGEPFPLAGATVEKVTPYSILCGDKAIVLILVNNDHQSNFEEGKPAFTGAPKDKFQVKVNIPAWLKVTNVRDVSWNDPRSLWDYKQEQDVLTISVDNLDITKQYLILTDRRGVVPFDKSQSVGSPQISDKSSCLDAVSKWKETSDSLERESVCNETMITAYDQQARYPEKHQAMRKYAETMYPGDKDKQTGWLKEQADKLKEQGEVTEAIILYRTIAKEYAEEIIREEIRKKGAFGKHHPVR